MVLFRSRSNATCPRQEKYALLPVVGQFLEKSLKFVAVLTTVFLLAACNKVQAEATQPTSNAINDATIQPVDNSLAGRASVALLDQIKCVRPPQAAVAMTAMLSRHLIGETDDGGDGIAVFIPVQQIKLLGFDIVRLAGWQPDPSGGAMPPFSRGPGTPPPTFISVTVRASASDVRRELGRVRIREGRWVPDLSREVWVDSAGVPHAPQRLVPGPTIEDGDYSLVQNPLQGVVTITCSADESDFRKEIEARFGG